MSPDQTNNRDSGPFTDLPSHNPGSFKEFRRIYLDNNASTPLDPLVADFIVKNLPLLQGNPSSSHSFGQAARSLINKAKASISSFFGVKSSELIFTSGGTESVNIAIRGLISHKPPGHIITSSVEHSCVIAVCKLMEAQGYSVSYLPSGPLGAVQPDAVKAAIRPDTQLIVLMAVNNETGVKTDIQSIARITQEHRIPFFVDAVSQLGKEVILIPPGISAMAFSGHKVHALQGIGLLYLRTGTKLQPLIFGGEQEYGRRAGTENVLGILSLSKAMELLSPAAYEGVKLLRDRFESVLLKAIPGLLINGEGARISNVSNLAFPGVDGEALLMNLDRAGIAASHGSACSSGSLEPSRILLGMGLPLERVNSSIRFSLSRLTTAAEIEAACATIICLVKKQI
ncbi:MAG TPA: cysteine desulfurase family protein [Parachlamydiaceae bacterium]|nr:cysteine desulfurase family protein [Parachlamydiaceae bacterium]